MTVNVITEKAIRNLRSFLINQRTSLDDIESAKLWRGIFYCKFLCW